MEHQRLRDRVYRDDYTAVDQQRNFVPGQARDANQMID